VTQPPLLRTARATLALVAIAAWLLAANHCVVAGLLPRTSAPSGERQECPAHKAPAKEQKSSDCDGSSCCKSLSAPLALAKILAGYNLAIFATADYATSTPAAVLASRAPIVLELDTGPPDSSSFAESVLQRSILAHAPPSLA
jgi:hypothetical protein